MNISFESVYKAISDNRDIKCLFLLNPTYYGACAQLEKIIKLCKDNNIPLVVFGIASPENIVKAVLGEKVGTIVK